MVNQVTSIKISPSGVISLPVSGSRLALGADSQTALLHQGKQETASLLPPQSFVPCFFLLNFHSTLPQSVSVLDVVLCQRLEIFCLSTMTTHSLVVSRLAPTRYESLGRQRLISCWWESKT